MRHDTSKILTHPKPAVVEFWDITNRQDWGLCERAQRGVRSAGYRPGPYNRMEVCVHTFDQWYALQVRDHLGQTDADRLAATQGQAEP